MSLRPLLYYGGLLLLAGASLWLLFSIRASLEPDRPREPSGPSLFLDRFLATRLDEQGVRLYTLSSPHLVELADERGTEIHQPRFEIFAADGTRDWLIDAEQGWVSADQSLVVLQQAVDAYQSASAQRPPVTIRTRDLIYRPRLNLLSTDAEVRLETPNGWLRGTGMRADLEERRLQLLWEVRGEYAPPLR